MLKINLAETDKAIEEEQILRKEFKTKMMVQGILNSQNYFSYLLLSF
jgi:hypothetical protein